ncbi:hypothetical protein ACQKP0_08595 [Heyndrickxia sp. NPDC080065]|uniref:hypothetical protein n=1 Tax=Heyndrickxia sp. NPDC080065 TaxID=3390568 RepID=UPI003D023D3B
MAYQPKSYRKFLAATASAAVVATAVVPAGASAASATVVSSVTAKDGSVTVKLNKKVSKVKTTDFKVTRKIGSGAAKTVKASKVTLGKDKKTVTVTLPKVAVTKKTQSVVVSVSYKGTKAKAAKAFKVAGKTTPPSLKVTGITNNDVTNKTKQTIKVTAGKDATKVVVTLNGKAVKGSKGSYALTYKANAANTVVVTAADKLGNTAKKTYKVTVDTKAPTLSINDIKDVVNEAEQTLKVTAEKGATVTVTLNGAKVTGTGSDYKLTLKENENTIVVTAKDKAGNQAKITKVVKYDATPAIKSVTASSSKTLKVEFNKAVDDTKAKFEVKKAGISVNVSKVTFADDKKSATLELSAKLTKGEYTVNVSGLTENVLTSTIAVEDEKVSKIEILSKVAVVDNSAEPKSATVGYRVVNQYGEDISNRVNLTTNDNTNISASGGKVSINVEGKKVGDKVAVTLIDIESTKTVTEVVELSAAASVNDVKVTGLYNKDGKTLTEDTNLSNDAFYLLVDAKDQYGNTITDAAKVKSGLILSETNPTVISTGTVNNVPNVEKITVDGQTKTAIKLTQYEVNGVKQGLKAGETTINFIAKSNGNHDSYTVKVAEATRADSVSLTQPELVVAKEDAFIPAVVTDKAGKNITDVKLLNDSVKGVKVSIGSQSGTFVTKDGALFLKVPSAALQSEGYVTVFAQSSTYKPTTLILNVRKAAEPAVIRGLNSDFSKTLLINKSTQIGHGDLVVEDQYGRVMSADKLKAALSGDTKVVVKKADADSTVFTVVGDNITGTNKSTVEAGKDKGSSKLLFILSKDGKEISSSTAEASIRVTDGKEYTSYTADELGLVYDVKGAGKTVASDDYDSELEVYGVLNDGSKVKLEAGTDFSITSTNAKVEKALEDGVITSSELGLSYDTNKSEVEASVTVTINSTGKQFTQKVTFSKAAPSVKSVKVYNGKDAVTSVSLKEGTTEFTVADLFKEEYAVKVTDQYGAVATANGTFADGTAISQAKLTIVPVSGSLTITGNGTTGAKVANLKAGNSFDATVVVGGVSTVVRVTVK